MPRDMELIRKILFAIEKEYVDVWLDYSDLKIEGYDFKTVGYDHTSVDTLRNVLLATKEKETVPS